MTGKGKILVPIALTLTSLLAGCRNISPNKNQSPSYDHFFQDKICFRDNFAPGMKAEISCYGEIMRLKKVSEGEELSFFYLPKHILMSNNIFYVWATDREGNRSPKQELYTRNGAISEKKPQQ